MLGGDTGGRDGGKVDDGHKWLLGGDKGGRESGKVDDGHEWLLGGDKGGRDSGKLMTGTSGCPEETKVAANARGAARGEVV